MTEIYRNLDWTTEALWKVQGPSLYFFILKRAQDTMVAQDVLQNTFLRVHEHLSTLKDPSKAKAWVFQIARNELADYYNRETATISTDESFHREDLSPRVDFCCFERFIEELPEKYQKVVKLVYMEGKTNVQAAEELNLSLPNIKARIRRAKTTLKQRFQGCCHFTLNKSGKLVGDSDCAICAAI